MVLRKIKPFKWLPSAMLVFALIIMVKALSQKQRKKMAKPEDVVKVGQELAEAKCDWQLHAYGKTSHAFMVPDANDKSNGLMFNADSERRATLASQDLLAEVFAEHGIDVA